MYADGIRVHVGDRVTAGQHIADVGVAGYSTGPHLHFEIRPGGANAAPADPEPWLASHEAADIDGGEAASDPGCGDEDRTGRHWTRVGVPRGEPRSPGRRPHHRRADHRADRPRARPSPGALPGNRVVVLVTSESARRSTRSAVPATAPSATPSAPPPTGSALDLGWKATNWLKANAQTLGVEYLIWQGRIWSVARSSEGWRPYDGGGMHDPGGVTGGHYDHLHFTVAGMTPDWHERRPHASPPRRPGLRCRRRLEPAPPDRRSAAHLRTPRGRPDGRGLRRHLVRSLPQVEAGTLPARPRRGCSWPSEERC